MALPFSGLRETVGAITASYMIVGSTSFWVFFLAVSCLYHSSRNRSYKLSVLAIASCFFYGAWNYRCLPILIGTSLTSFYVARAISQSTVEHRRNALLCGSIGLHLSVLALFKFVGGLVPWVPDALHLSPDGTLVPLVSYVVPLGLSYYTFYSISYVVEVYRGTIEPPSSLLEAARKDKPAKGFT